MCVSVVALLAMLAQTPAAGPSFAELSRKADEARDSNRLDEAVALYRKALKLKPNWADGWWAVGSITYDQDKYAECAPAFRRLAVIKPDSAAAWTMAGLCEYRLRQFSTALSSLERVAQLGFQENTELSRSARLHLAILLTHSSAFDRAITLLTELTRIDKKTPEIVMIVGIAGLRKPWLPSEVPESERDKVLKLGDAMGAAMEQDTKEAEEKFEVALQDYPSDANIHFLYGSFLRLQDLDRGIAEIKKAVEIDPRHIPALVGLAMIYLKNGEPETARGYAERAVKAAPDDFSSHIALGRALLDLDDAAGAARELEIATRLAPGSPEAHFSLASAYSRLGRKADAEREQELFKRLKKTAGT
jgi:tetratricopeptide (TPR) repeat protein